MLLRGNKKQNALETCLVASVEEGGQQGDRPPLLLPIKQLRGHWCGGNRVSLGRDGSHGSNGARRAWWPHRGACWGGEDGGKDGGLPRGSPVERGHRWGGRRYERYAAASGPTASHLRRGLNVGERRDPKGSGSLLIPREYPRLGTPPRHGVPGAGKGTPLVPRSNEGFGWGGLGRQRTSVIPTSRWSLGERTLTVILDTYVKI